MKLSLGIAATFGLACFNAGCGGPQAPPPPSVDTGAPASAAAPAGAEQAAGPFRITLSTHPADPKVGEAHLVAKVARGGEPVTDATVEISLSMPSMKMVGPEVTLNHTDGGSYEGTANLSMAGDWEAKTTVTVGGESGTAVHTFSAAQ
jgi:hypothetical protein